MWHASSCGGTQGVMSSLGCNLQNSKSANIPNSDSSSESQFSVLFWPSSSHRVAAFVVFSNRQQLLTKPKASEISTASRHCDHRPSSQSRTMVGTSFSTPARCRRRRPRSSTRRDKCSASSLQGTCCNRVRSRSPLSHGHSATPRGPAGQFSPHRSGSSFSGRKPLWRTNAAAKSFSPTFLTRNRSASLPATSMVSAPPLLLSSLATLRVLTRQKTTMSWTSSLLSTKSRQ
mmetsp:Transcript_49990/g.116040  ORF Transcript_49990/g.116040 Transcript_49990/m.116040 type:complete len:231 (+) Transcript_49990:224-916(+)